MSELENIEEDNINKSDPKITRRQVVKAGIKGAAALIGLGALTGDLVKSFFKRRLGFEPGAKFVPFDQTDFVVGALLFIMPIFGLTLKIFFVSLLLSFMLHIIVNHLAFYLRIRNEKW